MKKQTCTIINRKGMHARAAAEIVKLVEQFDSDITINLNGNQVPANSLIHLLTLAANCGKTVEITADGHDETKALRALCELIENRFYESE